MAAIATRKRRKPRCAGEGVIMIFDRYWRIRATLPDRFGHRLAIIARGTMNSALVQFEDGTRHIVNRWAFRKC
jgi:hypothetical protein